MTRLALAVALLAAPLAAHAAGKYRVYAIAPTESCPSDMQDVLTMDTKDNKFRICVGEPQAQFFICSTTPCNGTVLNGLELK